MKSNWQNMFRSRKAVHIGIAMCLISSIHAQPQQGRSQARFESIPVAQDSQQNSVVASSRFWSRNIMQSISYKTLARSGDLFGQTVFGQLVNARQQVAEKCPEM